MIELTLDQIEEADNACEGFCASCGHQQPCVEPDAENYECEECGEPEVFGAQQIVLLGKVAVT